MNHDGDTLEGDFDRTTLACFAASLLDGQTGDVSLQLHRFSAGLESRVARVVARARFGDRRSRSYAFVVKEAAHARCQVEASVYAHLAGLTSIGFPRLLGFQNDDERTYLFLEYVRPAQSWPWRHVEYTSLVLECLARLHSLAVEAPLREIVAWEYEAELRQSGLNTLDSVERAAIQNDMRWLRPARRIVRKVVASLASMRAELLQAAPFGTTLLHGDVHTGNVRLRARGGQLEAMLLDWGRARFGSPFEDVASWLLSLGCWEPEARRRHDTLLRRYLVARGLAPVIGPELRRAYWLAAASNVLGGALNYQVGIAAGWTGASLRDRSIAAGIAQAHVRALRRALALWSCSASRAAR